MKLPLVVIVLTCICTVSVFAQDSKIQLYDPDARAAAELQSAIAYASVTGKHVLIQVGGNWCPWCIKLDKLMGNDHEIDSLLNADYIWIRVNYSKENKNLDVLKRLENPQRFGFPVLVLLDGAGQRLHTQDSGLLEKDGAHDPEAVYRFLYLWRPEALAAPGE